MKLAFRQVLSDFLSAILFLVAYAVTGSLFAALVSLSLSGWCNSPVSG